MRIGLSCTTIKNKSENKLDGIGMYTKHLYDEFVKTKCDIIPVTFKHSYMRSTLYSILCPAISHNKNIEKQIDIFHSTDHMIPKFKHIPVVATLNDALMFKQPDWYRSKLRPLKNFIRKKTMSWADHFITISNTMVAELVEYCDIPEEKISVIYDGISPEWFEKISAEIKQRVLTELKLPEKFLLYAGTIQPKKNLPRLITAYLNLPRDIQQTYPLVIVGKIGWDTEESMKAIQQLISQGAGYWLDYVSTDTLRTLFQSATAYIHPSLHEGFGLTLLEAFASETPVITSNIAAMPETANGAAYLIDPYSVSEIQHAIESLLTNSSLQNTLIEKGIVRAKEFSWEKCAAETIGVYEKLV